ncbi:hypothetical protein [Roseivivax sediminis]|uniref:hypothetical protein n=1 Tax=Roseivivax sediminis TaxID=936889 RepID=UPI00165F02C9|nr:hypothetical protein [Roseivivax sediminis]
MDPNTGPRQDYRYAVGGRLDRVERPEKSPKYGIFATTGELVRVSATLHGHPGNNLAYIR